MALKLGRPIFLHSSTCFAADGMGGGGRVINPPGEEVGSSAGTLDVDAEQMTEDLATLVQGAQRARASGEKVMGTVRALRDRVARLEQETASVRCAHQQVGQRAIDAAAQIAAVRDQLADGLKAYLPMLGTGSPLAETMEEALAGLENVAEYLVPGGVEARPLRSERRSADPTDIVAALTDIDQVRHPWLSRDAAEGLSVIAGRSASATFSRLSLILTRNVSIANKFLRSVTVLASHRRIPGSDAIILSAIAALVHPGGDDALARGMIHQVIRLAGLVQAGRRLDGMGVVVARKVQFRGWWMDRRARQALPRTMIDDVEADAVEGDALIEIKRVFLGARFGDYLQILLDGASGNEVINGGRADNGNGADPFQMAVKKANQLLRYRQLIVEGKSRKLELHVTSRDPVPVETVDAIHRAFPPQSVEVWWYRNTLRDDAVRITPRVREPASVVSAPPVPEVSDSPEKHGLPTEQAISDEPERAETPVIAIEEDVPSPRELAGALVYSNLSVLDEFDHDSRRVQPFIDWLINAGEWDKISSLAGDEQEHELKVLVNRWLSRGGSRTITPRQENPWSRQVTDQRAKRKINSMMKQLKSRGHKGKEIDWRQRKAIGVNNNDIISILKGIREEVEELGRQRKKRIDEDAMEAFTARLNNFVMHIRNRYKLDAYVIIYQGNELVEDVATLIDIFKQYFWLIEGGKA